MSLDWLLRKPASLDAGSSQTKPKEWQVYIETMYSMAAGVEKKYWKFLGDMTVEKKERKKKKDAEKIETKTEKAEATTETKTEPAA